MSTHQSVDRDERTAAVEKDGIIWAYNFLAFALLIDVMYRGWVLHQDAWDLLLLVIASGAVSWIYVVRHQSLSRPLVGVMLVVAVVAFVVAVIGTMVGSG